MDLWIRSQDKKVLVKINNIWVDENGIIYTDSYPDMWLGAYKSEKRAIEVLDEIQKLLMPTYLISNISKEDGLKLQDNIAFATSIIQTEDNSKIEQINSSIIYLMPKE